MKNKKNILFFFLLLFFVLPHFTCKKSEDRRCFKSNGKITKQNRPASPFNSIILNDKINLIITQDSIHEIIVEAPENLMNFIKTDISENQLTVKNENKCDFLRTYKYEINVFVSVADLKYIDFKGAGNITSTDTIKTTEITFDFNGASGSLNMAIEAVTSHCNIHTGTGDIILAGISEVSYFYSNAYGFMYLQNLSTGYSYIRNSGTGDFYVNVQKELEVVITSDGSVFYKGNPYSIKKDISGKGELSKI